MFQWVGWLKVRRTEYETFENNKLCYMRYLLFWKTYAQPAIGVICIMPPGVCPTQSPRKLFLSSSRMRIISTFQRPDLHYRTYQFLEEKHSLLGSLPQLSARRTLYDNSVHGNWLHPKGIAKVSGILEGSDSNIKSIYERLRKGPKRKD